MRLKKIKFVYLLACCFAFFTNLEAKEILLEGKVSYFHPTSHQFRSVYSGGGLYRIEGSFQVWKNLYPWISAGFFYRTGLSTGSRQSTRITMIPAAIGAKWLFPFKRNSPYIGLGMPVTYIHMHNNSSFVARSQSGWAVGALAQIGCFSYITESIFLDTFVDYMYLKKGFSVPKGKNLLTSRGDFSGLSFGAGLGYRF